MLDYLSIFHVHQNERYQVISRKTVIDSEYLKSCEYISRWVGNGIHANQTLDRLKRTSKSVTSTLNDGKVSKAHYKHIQIHNGYRCIRETSINFAQRHNKKFQMS